MNKKLIKKEPQAIALAKEIDAFLLGSNIVDKLSPTQIDLCKRTALAFGLNPIKREIHFVPYQNKKTGKYDVSIIVGYEVYLKRAEESGKLDGWEVKVERVKSNHGKVLTRAVVTIYRKDWNHPFVHEVYLHEVIQNSPLWRKMPIFMLKKVAVAQAFRWAFPMELAGMPYVEGELPVDDEVTTTTEAPVVTATQVEQKPAENKPKDTLASEGQIKFIKLLQEQGKVDKSVDISKLTWTEAREIIRASVGKKGAANAKVDKKEAPKKEEAQDEVSKKVKILKDEA